MELSRQEYGSVLPFPAPGNLPTQGLNQRLLRLLHGQIGYHCTTWETLLRLSFL